MLAVLLRDRMIVGWCWSGNSIDKLKEVLPEGLPAGMKNEFEESMRSAVLVRQSFLDLRDNFRRIVDPPMFSDGKGW